MAIPVSKVNRDVRRLSETRWAVRYKKIRQTPDGQRQVEKAIAGDEFYEQLF